MRRRREKGHTGRIYKGFRDQQTGIHKHNGKRWFFIDYVVKIADYLGMQVVLKGENEYVIKEED